MIETTKVLVASESAPEGRHEPSGQFVRSLERGLDVIKAFDAEHPKMTLSEIARKVDLTRASTRRFLLTLIELNYVRTDGRVFELTAKILDLGFSYLSALSLPEIAQPHLEDLAVAVYESTSASVLEGSDIIYVARVPSRRIMTVRINVGTRFPAYATSMGKVLLSELTPAVLDAHLEGATLAPLTSWTITSRKALDRELARVRQRGWAIADQELEAGLRSIAVPVRDRSGVIIAAVNVSTTTTRHTLESLEQNLLPLLEIAVARIRSDYATARAYAQGRSGYGLNW